MEGFKPKTGNCFDEPFTYIRGIYYGDLNNTVRIDYFIEKEGLSSKSYAAMVSLNDEEVSNEMECDKLFLVQCAYKLLSDFKDSIPDCDSTKEDFNTQFPSLNREWLSEVGDIDTNIHML